MTDVGNQVLSGETAVSSANLSSPPCPSVPPFPAAPPPDDVAAWLTLSASRRAQVLRVFAPDWTAVDRARATTAALGLDRFVSVHHRDALRFGNVA